ncbi:mitochondrial ATP-independent inner membrane protease subunit 1a-like [Alnus glutinosa]|uniref:mitochondrial ATP-independent inner membrane protease subunit 1a-like n=1 Tax=Alnus glutinosa TaxID=3517 RepID=UPI002D798F92|nr:mitochondrial ATP-independent inner membrane protease subunit 1a-like [Alnus glutinosa]XP_062161083.1 mitochondrial ATP-independent inner membrane protease subunit 1a-like [Alnus glutinosa]XP_062161084.1 mitochondrial ATP-independent inner membrane protease subunit 1a-like [Alnus glutinosa]
MGLRKLWQYRSIVKEAWDQTMAVATLLCGLHVTNTYLCTLGLAYGPSMLPTFNLTGDLFLADRLSTMFGKVGRGDVVLVRSPENPRKLLAKRLLGMQGDSVTYVVDPKNSDRSETVVVPKGHVWIEGDNIYASRDSRQYGPVPYGLVEGKIFWKIWPPKEFGSLGQSRMKDPDL